jgi:hypothetical protein
MWQVTDCLFTPPPYGGGYGENWINPPSYDGGYGKKSGSRRRESADKSTPLRVRLRVGLGWYLGFRYGMTALSMRGLGGNYLYALKAQPGGPWGSQIRQRARSP